MSQEIDEMTAGLEEVAVNENGEKAARRRREQTPEDVEVIKAGVAKLVELGVSDHAKIILETLVPVWYGSDEEKALAKETVINAFGSSDLLKDYIDADAKNELKAYAGIAKIMPIFNNICSFYARRTNKTKKAAQTQVNIGGQLYLVDKAYYESLADKSKEEKRELLLAHEGTKLANDVFEML